MVCGDAKMRGRSSGALARRLSGGVWGDTPFGYVNVFTSHVNVGFFQGASLPDPARLLQGNGKFMRHVKLTRERQQPKELSTAHRDGVRGYKDARREWLAALSYTKSPINGKPTANYKLSLALSNPGKAGRAGRGEIDVQIKVSRGINYVGTHYGGSLYSMADPFFMLMLMENLGPEYIVWDKSASIRFRRPGRGTVSTTFQLSEQQLAEIRKALTSEEKVNGVFIEVKARKPDVVAEIDKQLNIRKKSMARALP